jgi:hypothetical protein
MSHWPKSLILYGLVFFLVNQTHLLAYDTDLVHPKINASVVLGSSATLANVLKQQLGFQEALRKSFYGWEITRWIEEGGRREDDIPNPLLHFHDSLLPWEQAGLGGSGWSALVWAQLYAGLAGNNHSWVAAREHFYNAVTTNFDYEWAMTFRALGQVMHLVSDMAVPAHVRSDRHYPVPDPYEKWASVNLKQPTYESEPVDASIFARAVVDPMWSIPISALWDQDVYQRGSSPPTGLVGLAEFTNAHFLSSDTSIETCDTCPPKDYPHPALEDTDFAAIDWKHPEIVAVQGDLGPPLPHRRVYVHNVNLPPRNGLPVRMAAAGYLCYDAATKGKVIDLYKSPYFVLDDEVHRSYAAELIPRAVGYSAALLDYFFRGNISISLPDQGYYAVTDPVRPEEGFKEIRLRAQNITPEAEEMGDGIIKLVVKYRLALEDPFRNYPYPPTVWEYTHYAVFEEKDGKRTIPRNTQVELTFDLASSPVPLWATDVYVQVVFRGPLGREQDAVVLGFKDVNEPTPVQYFNNLDKVCLSGNWLDAGSAPAIGLVDSNQDGVADLHDVYAHDVTELFIKLSSISDPRLASNSDYDSYQPRLTAGTATPPVYVLTDSIFVMSNSGYWITPTDGRDPWGPMAAVASAYSAPAIKNQTEVADPAFCLAHGAKFPCYVRYYPRFSEFRGQDLWAPVIITGNPYPAEPSCALEALQ